MKDHVNILGSEYSIEVQDYDAYPAFKERSCDGFCLEETRQIILCDMRTWPGREKESEVYVDHSMCHTLRHEIVHAFFYESGLSDSSAKYDGGWAKFEEMIDWLAIQGPKLYAAWKAAEAL